MVARLLFSIIVLPGTVLVAIPAALLWIFRATGFRHARAGAMEVQFWLAVVLALGGLSLATWTVSLFFRFGRGTPAPWDPPKKFVVRGPYCHVRNPMILAVFLMLCAEALMLRSWPLCGWFAAFMLANAVYIPFFEEKKLLERFGEDYRVYTRNVRRWMPRLTAWKA